MSFEFYMRVALAALAALYLFPVWALVRFAKREKKDWRIALVAGLGLTWPIALLILLVVPKLSDEDHERINKPPQKTPRPSKPAREKIHFEAPSANEIFAPVMWGLGIATAGLAALMLFVMLIA